MDSPFALEEITAAEEMEAEAVDVLEKLNPEQREAVETLDGPLLVLAGAGTGKTRVLTTRIAHIIATNTAFPSQILAVTFTNKAAREMQQRVESLLPGYSGGVWLGTFHSICLRILRRHAELVGLKTNFTILDQDDQIRLLKQIMEEQHIDTKRWPAKALGGWIQAMKDRGLTPQKVTMDDVGEFAGGKALKLYEDYQARLKALNAADFGDLLLHCITLFTAHGDVLAEYQRRFHYILVDEYQDTNVAQYLWLRLLAQEHKNICCVGDDDQSIYGWRGAEVGNILRFEKDFEGARVIRLERNYRSTSDILAAASALIAHNEGRLGKTLWTEEAGESHKVNILSLWDEKHEAKVVGEAIQNLQHQGKDLGEIAILVRAGFQTRAFEECFISMSIPYKVIGGLRFYERMEIRDAIAYMRLLAQDDDDLAFERIINTPKRGVGKSALDQIREVARTENISLLLALRQKVEQGEFGPKLQGVLQQFIQHLDRWRGLLETVKHWEVVDVLLKESGYIEMWKREKTPDAAGRVENLNELIAALEEFDDLGQFLEHVSLVSDVDELDDSKMAKIMTLHSAKGLEFDTVFLPGWEEGLFPHQKALDESGKKGLEEERRLGYVGITRARQHLTISFAANRRIFNQWQSSIPSRFIDELPAAHTEVHNLGTGYTRRQDSGSTGMRDSAKSRFTAPPKTTVAKKNERFAPGKRIFHQKFGYGVVLSKSGDQLTIAFEKSSTKTILQDFVEEA